MDEKEDAVSSLGELAVNVGLVPLIFSRKMQY